MICVLCKKDQDASALVTTPLGPACATHPGVGDARLEASKIVPAKPVRPPPFIFSDFCEANDVSRPDISKVVDSIEADARGEQCKFVAHNFAPNPGAKRTLLDWARGWRDVSRKMAMEYGTASTLKGPSAKAIAKKKNRSDRDREIRAKMKKKK